MTRHTITEYRAGDWVIIALLGPRFGSSGVINRAAASDDTDLTRYHIGGEWYYADELVAQPGGGPEWALPAGPAHDIAALARKCGWAVHTTETDTHTGRVIAAISPAGADGVWRRVHAVWDSGWTWAVETIDARGLASRSGLGRRTAGTQQELEAVISAHSDSSLR